MDVTRNGMVPFFVKSQKNGVESLRYLSCSLWGGGAGGGILTVFSYCRSGFEGQGDVSVGKVLAMQIPGPESEPQNLCKKPCVGCVLVILALGSSVTT